MTRFAELDTNAFLGAIVIVDVDGTIVHDTGTEIDSEAKSKLLSLAGVSDVYLLSNSTNTDRTKAIASSVPGVRFLDTIYKKPNKLILNSMPAIEDRRVVVIGDKELTDGRFARNIGAEFVAVSRMRHSADARAVVAIYIVDDAFSIFRNVIGAIVSIVALLRMRQWIKNVLVFAPLFFAQEALSRSNVIVAGQAFGVFCLAASTVYVMNDIFDLEADRAHPKKRFRPLASGALPISIGYMLLGTLLGITTALLVLLPNIALAVGVYIILNVFYSLSMKHIAILDIACVAAFYILRIVAGGAATAIPISPWIILCVFFGALFLVIGKRRAEFAHISRRRVIESYSMPALNYLLAGSAFLAIISYAIYSAIGSRSPLAIYSTVFVVIAIFRLLNRMFTDDDGEAENPESLLFKDRWAFGAFIAWAAYMFGILYL